MRRAYRDRAVYLGDEDYIAVPAERLISEEYIRQLVADISTERASSSADFGTLGESAKGTNTTHFSIID